MPEPSSTLALTSLAGIPYGREDPTTLAIDLFAPYPLPASRCLP